MIQKHATLADFHIAGWFFAFIFCSAVWGLLAGGIAFQYEIPFDSFNLYPAEHDLYHCFLLGMAYCSAIAFSLVILEKLGAYNPVVAFVILMAGIILFVDMLFGRTSIVNSQHPVWLLLVPVVVVRDVVTYFYLCDRYRNSDEIHEIDISCKTIDEPNFSDEAEVIAESHEKSQELSELEALAFDMSEEAAEYGKNRTQYLRA